MSKRRITLKVLLAEAPDTIREIEMAVDSAVFVQAVSIQFWEDVRLYGLREACLYLHGYAVKGAADLTKVKAIMLKCDELAAKMNATNTGVQKQERPFTYNQQPEGNGFDHPQGWREIEGGEEK